LLDISHTAKVSLLTSGAWKMKNPTLLQCFHWYYPTGGELWPEVEALAPSLNEIGINMVWLPPAYKGASGGYSVGYDTYDLFDLGEFDQKGSVATKYGDKAQLLAGGQRPEGAQYRRAAGCGG